MEKFSFYFKCILIFVLGLLIINFISSIIYLYTGISYNLNCFILFIFTVLMFAILNFYIGKKTPQKGYLAGLKLGGTLISLFLILSLITKSSLSLSSIPYYGILLLISTISASLGINCKNKSNLK